MHAYRNAALWHQIGILAAAQSELCHVRVGIHYGLLINLLFGRHRRFANEIDREIEQPFLRALGQHVFDNLRQAIIRGNIAPGEWLVESHIAQMLGISRTPVREAIHKLEREMLIERQPRGGFTVLGLNRDDIEETFGIRSILEGYAARLATVKHHPRELKVL